MQRLLRREAPPSFTGIGSPEGQEEEWRVGCMGRPVLEPGCPGGVAEDEGHRGKWGERVAFLRRRSRLGAVMNEMDKSMLTLSV